MVAVELCAGAGGLARGLMAADIDIAVAVEREVYAAATYRLNFPDVELIEGDVRDLAGGEILRRVDMKRGNLDLLVAGLPCQGFSESNRRTRMVGNPRNLLYREVLRLLGEVAPRWFVIENVAGIGTLKSGRFLEDMLDEFRAVGYRTMHEVLNAADFGVPQCRRRTFIVGTRTEKEFVFPKAGNQTRATVRDAIADLPELENGASEDKLPYRGGMRDVSEYAASLRGGERKAVTGNEVSKNSAKVVERYSYIGMGQNWSAIPVELMENYTNRRLCHTGIYYRLCWDEQAKVIGNFRKNMLIHPAQDRGLSIREAARLQSFDDCHQFFGPLNHRQQQVGDAVPPRLAEAIGGALGASDGS